MREGEDVVRSSTTYVPVGSVETFARSPAGVAPPDLMGGGREGGRGRGKAKWASTGTTTPWNTCGFSLSSPPLPSTFRSPSGVISRLFPSRECALAYVVNKIASLAKNPGKRGPHRLPPRFQGFRRMIRLEEENFISTCSFRFASFDHAKKKFLRVVDFPEEERKVEWLFWIPLGYGREKNMAAEIFCSSFIFLSSPPSLHASTKEDVTPLPSPPFTQISLSSGNFRIHVLDPPPGGGGEEGGRGKGAYSIQFTLFHTRDYTTTLVDEGAPHLCDTSF